MTRLVPIAVVLALVWVALSWPDRLVYTLVGFGAGCAFTGSLPWFVRWGQEQARRARDSEGAGGHGVRTERTAEARCTGGDYWECPVHGGRLHDAAAFDRDRRGRQAN